MGGTYRCAVCDAMRCAAVQCVAGSKELLAATVSASTCFTLQRPTEQRQRGQKSHQFLSWGSGVELPMENGSNDASRPDED